MKYLLAIIVGLLAAWGVFYLDSLFINWILAAIPPSGHDWLALIKVILWVLAVCWTGGLAIAAGFFCSMLITVIFPDK